jgi:radical S-adenosyl methionine domain-containing protein 2
MKNKIYTVNYHLWKACNMRCKFCYATFQDYPKDFLPKGHLPLAESKLIIDQTAAHGFKKINFAGGEPTLCSWLPELVIYAKSLNLETSIVTNGWTILKHDDYLVQFKGSLDIVGVSIDSVEDDANRLSGRAQNGKKPISKADYLSIAQRVKDKGIYLKINTVVARHNFEEKLTEFINEAKPNRWKILQMLPVAGQNDEFMEQFQIINEEYEKFMCDNIVGLNADIKTVKENNDTLTGSYIMIDPGGRFFDDTKGKHTYSEPILEVGLETALKQTTHDVEKFNRRDGNYSSMTASTNLPSRITLSGQVASGKSTIGKMLAKRLNYAFSSIGNTTREFAEKQGMSIVEFQQACLKDTAMDHKIDKEFSVACSHKENVVIDYRLGFHFVKNAFHIFLKVSEKTAIDRLQSADRENETHDTLQERNNAFSQQFERAYQVDYTDPANYGLVVDVDQFNTPEEIVDHIINNLSGKAI